MTAELILIRTEYSGLQAQGCQDMHFGVEMPEGPLISKKSTHTHIHIQTLVIKFDSEI